MLQKHQAGWGCVLQSFSVTASWLTLQTYQEPNRLLLFLFPFLIPMQTILETLYTVVLSSAWGWQTLHKRARSKNSRRLQLQKRLGCPFPADNCKRVQWFAYEFRHIWTLCFNIPLVQLLCPLGAGWLTVSRAPNYAKNALYPLCLSYMAICTSSKVGSSVQIFASGSKSNSFFSSNGCLGIFYFCLFLFVCFVSDGGSYTKDCNSSGLNL